MVATRVLKIFSTKGEETTAAATNTKDTKPEQIDTLQNKGLTRIFTAVQENESLSIDLIKELHKMLSPPYVAPLNMDTMAPELWPPLPGEFRNRITGAPIKEEVSEQGIFEILTILEDEAKEGFDNYKGTWIGPKDPKTGKLSIEESIRHDNLAEKLQEFSLSKPRLAKKIYEDIQEEEYHFLYTRCSRATLDIQAYVKMKIKQLIEQFNFDIKATNSPDEKKRLIVAFIKKCIRLHPFCDANHRVFALCTLNFLLLSNNLGYCPLKNRRIFNFISIDETLEYINSSLVPCDIRAGSLQLAISGLFVQSLLPIQRRSPVEANSQSEYKPRYTAGFAVLGGTIGFFGGKALATAAVLATIGGISPPLFLGICTVLGAIALPLIAYGIYCLAKRYVNSNNQCEAANNRVAVSMA